MDRLLKILIIDDDEVDRAIIKRAIKASQFNHVITEYSEASVVMEQVQQNEFDCIFLDYNMPDTDGLNLLKKIKKAGVLTPVIITTAQQDEAIAVEMMKAGAHDYLDKKHIHANIVAQIFRNIIRFRDIERQKEFVERALKQSEARLSEAQKIAQIGNWEFDVNEQSFYCSDEVYRILEVPDKNVVHIDENYLEYFYPEDIQLIQETITKVKHGESFKMDCRILTYAGNVKYCNIQGYSVLNYEKKIIKIIGTIQNITERKQTEQQLIEAKKMADELTLIKDSFLATMSHEIRTPLTAIIGFSNLLAKSELNEEQETYMKAIHYAGENLLTIINDILDFSKIKAGKLTFENIYFELMDIIHPLIEMFQLKATENNIELSYQIEGNVPMELQGDPVRLNQVLINLLSNALKFTEKGCIKIHIKIISQDDDNALLKFSVEDTGIGISENKLDSIFESFTQANSNTTRKYGGSGLGLSIVKNIVDLQGGTIAVKSIINKGSIFTFNLPFKKAKKHKKTTDNTDFIKGGNLKEIKILLVEDNKTNQQLVSIILNKMGYGTVDIASSGFIAIEKIKQSMYDILLMDIEMPEMDGYEVTQRIRTQFEEPISNIPIIAMTAHTTSDAKEKCIAVGMNDIISKPFKTEILVNKINQLIANHHLLFNQPIDAALEQTTNNIDLKSNTEKLMIDLSYLKMLLGDDKKDITETISLLLREIPIMIIDMNTHLENKDWKAMRQTAHKIKPSFGLLHIENAQEIIKTIEKYALEETHLEALPDLINKITSISQDAMEQVKVELKNLSN